MSGITEGRALTAAALAADGVRITVDPPRRAGDVVVTLNGEPVPATADGPGRLRWQAPVLPDGAYALEAAVDRPLFGAARTTVRFVVDSVPPVLEVPDAVGPVEIGLPVSVTGRVESGATVTVDGTAAAVDDGGSFAAELPFAPVDPVRVVATDAAGNTATAEVEIPVTYPGARGVHISAAAWSTEERRNAVLRLIDERRITVVQLDLKDESGEVGYDSEVPLAREIGAVMNHYRLRETIADLHARGVRVVGRIVAFRDPILARAAWARGDRDWVLQTPTGEPLANYGGFTNYVHPAVRRYNLDLAEEAARAGIDDILWDYIRRPEGNPSSMVVPGLTGKTAEHITSFLDEGHRMLRRYGVFQGASVFGIAATRPDTIGQHIPSIARVVDYVSPMVYPSHWNKGEYGVADPNRMPYEIVAASLADFAAVLQGSGAVLVPWLQDFSMGVTYGAAEVRAQIRAAADLGIESFLLWNASSRYTPGTLDPVG